MGNGFVSDKGIRTRSLLMHDPYFKITTAYKKANYVFLLRLVAKL